MQIDPTLGARSHQRLRALIATQQGVISRAQAVEMGISRSTIRSQVAAGRWRVLSDGVYFAANSRPGRPSQLWAALLASGRGAVLSHRTAAEIFGFGASITGSIEVSIPDERQEVSVTGVRVRRSRLLPAKATTFEGWPITTPADTVLDLINEMKSPHAVVALLTDACRTKAVAPRQIMTAMSGRSRQRHRQLVKDSLADVVSGVESLLEYKYLVRVERAHGLPAGRRQVKGWANGIPIRRDVDYEDYTTSVELDGRAGHEGSGRHRDRRRDNAGLRRGWATLRYGHADLEDPCAAAQEVAEVLSRRGWDGVLQACGPRCSATR